MTRAIICCLALFAFTPAVRAGELDREAGPAKAATAPADIVKAPVGSEMDRESPQDAYHYHGHWGGYRGFGWGGYGYRGLGWGGYGYRGLGWGGYGYRGLGWGYRGFYPGFYGYRTYGWRWPGSYYNWAWSSYYPSYYAGYWW